MFTKCNLSPEWGIFVHFGYDHVHVIWQLKGVRKGGFQVNGFFVDWFLQSIVWVNA